MIETIIMRISLDFEVVAQEDDKMDLESVNMAAGSDLPQLHYHFPCEAFCHRDAEQFLDFE